jgi:hypothetical protein
MNELRRIFLDDILADNSFIASQRTTDNV